MYLQILRVGKILTRYFLSISSDVIAEKEWHYSHTLRINNTSSLLYFLQGQKNVLSSSREVDIDDLDMFFGIVR